MNITRFDNVKAIAEGGKEIKVDINGEEIWIPKIQIHASSEVKEAPDEGALIVHTFWAKKNRLVA
jgi:hypothetical protein